MDKFSIKFTKKADKFLKKQDKTTQLRLIKAILKIPTGELRISNVIGYPHLLKIRVGHFRVIFDKDFTQIIEVMDIGNRGEIYNNY